MTKPKLKANSVNQLHEHSVRNYTDGMICAPIEYVQSDHSFNVPPEEVSVLWLFTERRVKTDLIARERILIFFSLYILQPHFLSITRRSVWVETVLSNASEVFCSRTQHLVLAGSNPLTIDLESDALPLHRSAPMLSLCCGLHVISSIPASILGKSTSGRHRPVSYSDGPMTARYRFT